MIDIETQKEQVTKAARSIVDSTVSAGNRAVDFSTGAATTVAAKAKELLGRTKEAAEVGIGKVNAVKVGDKNVGERVEETVESVSSAVDVDQITEQVAKLRQQIDGLLNSWKESFRPSNGATSGDAVEAPQAPKTAKKTAPKAKTATKPASKATASKKPAASKATASKSTTKTAPKKSAPKKS
ncbi:MAG: hypothetical protein R2823_03915 [Acidimicrobiia bacterium]